MSRPTRKEAQKDLNELIEMRTPYDDLPYREERYIEAYLAVLDEIEKLELARDIIREGLGQRCDKLEKENACMKDVVDGVHRVVNNPCHKNIEDLRELLRRLNEGEK